MDMVTLLVDVVIALWFLAVIVGIVRAWRARAPRLIPLAPETRHQFVSSWHRITAGFIDRPKEAVQQADALVVSLLRERGRPVRQDQLPKPIREARKLGAEDGAGATEGLRLAMLRYRSVFAGSIGRAPVQLAESNTRRREMA